MDSRIPEASDHPTPAARENLADSAPSPALDVEREAQPSITSSQENQQLEQENTASTSNGTAGSRTRLNLLRTSTFRLALVFLVIYGLSSFLILGFIYYTTAVFIDQQANETIIAESTGLQEQYRSNGLAGLIAVVAERSARDRADNAIYLLADPSYGRIVGNLVGWPEQVREADGFIEFAIQSIDRDAPPDADPGESIARAEIFRLVSGHNLLVGRNLQEHLLFQEIVTQSLLWALVITLGFGLIGGLFFSRNLLKRVDSISQTSRRIVTGDLSQRMPVRGTGDEFDDLATTLNTMLAQIERLMDGMRTMTDNVAHDLRGPLTRMKARLEVTLLDPPAQESDRAAIRETIDETDRILATFNAILDIARAETGSLKEAFEELNLSEITHDVLELYEPIAEEGGKSVSATLESGVQVIGNRHLLAQALANLIDNAIKYAPPETIIAVTLKRQPMAGEIVLTVSDAGPGIPASERDRVLERFVRLEKSRHAPGNGLGLSLVAAVSRLHGASLELSDSRPGKEPPGLSVTLRFNSQD